MICLWISIVIGFVNDFVIERFGKERAGLWARSGLRDSFFYFGKIALVPGRELPGQIDKAHLSRMLNPGWKTGINARWQPGLKGSSVLVYKLYQIYIRDHQLCALLIHFAYKPRRDA